MMRGVWGRPRPPRDLAAAVALVVVLANLAVVPPVVAAWTGSDVLEGWDEQQIVIGGEEPYELVVSGSGVDVAMVRIKALDPLVRLNFTHSFHMAGQSAYDAVGALSSTAYRLRDDGSVARDNGMIIYTSGRGTIGAEAAGVEAGPVFYLPASEGPAGFSVPRQIHHGDGGMLWQVFSTYPESTWAHSVLITGRSEVTVYDPPLDVLRVVGREAYDPPPLTWGNGAWVFPVDSEATVQIDTPVYGRVDVERTFLLPLGAGALHSPSGTVFGPEDDLGLAGLSEVGTWRFTIDAGNYAMHPAQLVGVETPDDLWG